MNRFRLLVGCRLFGRPTGGLSRIVLPLWARDLASKVDPDFGVREGALQCFTADVEAVWACNDLLWVPERSYLHSLGAKGLEARWLEKVWLSSLDPRPLSSLELDFVVAMLGGAEDLRRFAVVDLRS